MDDSLTQRLIMRRTRADGPIGHALPLRAAPSAAAGRPRGLSMAAIAAAERAVPGPPSRRQEMCPLPCLFFVEFAPARKV